MAIKFSDIKSTDTLSATDVAKYFYMRAISDGELISPLKMQKIVYLAYVEFLKKTHKRLFLDKIEAWQMGPVIVNLYHVLKSFGSMPIDESFIKDIKDPDKFVAGFKKGVREILDEVYEKYVVLSAFELVRLTHAQEPWLKARKGISLGDSKSNVIKDKDILAYDC